MQSEKHIHYINDGKARNEYYYLPDNKTLHREDGPAVVYFDRYGSVQKEMWWHNNKLHRVGGPAVYGPYMLDMYFINGIQYQKEQYEEYFRNTGDLEQQELLVDLGQSFE